VVDYREMVKKEKEEGKPTWALFPINQWDPLEQTPDVMAAPSQSHWIGTDSLGRDVTARLLYGLRVSLAYGLLFWAACFFCCWRSCAFWLDLGGFGGAGRLRCAFSRFWRALFLLS